MEYNIRIIRKKCYLEKIDSQNKQKMILLKVQFNFFYAQIRP